MVPHVLRGAPFFTILAARGAAERIGGTRRKGLLSANFRRYVFEVHQFETHLGSETFSNIAFNKVECCTPQT
jgi:hypothetical protein